jgi:hypothetical protein
VQWELKRASRPCLQWRFFWLVELFLYLISSICLWEGRLVSDPYRQLEGLRGCLPRAEPTVS